jgi:hypothetical protein
MGWDNNTGKRTEGEGGTKWPMIRKNGIEGTALT